MSTTMTTLKILLLWFGIVKAASDCSKEAYDDCIRIADPLVKEAHLIFPDNMNDIDVVCRTWNRFVDCLKFYTDNCFSDQQRKQFNKAVENPIESVHQMCRQPSYQKEYLQYAPCIKNTITERSHCGQHYNLLVDQVSQGDIISKSTLCCSHDRFKQCVSRETRRLCDRGLPDGPASRFSAHIIDKSLSFLQDQCLNYIPNSGDCHAIMSTDSTQQTFSDPLTISTSSSEVYPWSTIQQHQQQPEMKDIGSSRATTAWLPSSTLSIRPPAEQPSLGSRTRPASYGRASAGWSTVMTSPSPTPEMTRPSWVMSSTFLENGRRNEGNERGSTTWYPAAGDQVGNEVDEPNQQGWSKPKNNGGGRGKNFNGGLGIVLGGFIGLVIRRGY